MVNIVEEFEKEQIMFLSAGKTIPIFSPGDTIKVEYSSNLGDNVERSQNFEGLCIRRTNRGLSSSFLLRKLSYHGVYVEKYFPLYSPNLKSISVIKRGVVRRAKLYYVRHLSGKASRIKERVSYSSKQSPSQA